MIPQTSEGDFINGATTYPNFSADGTRAQFMTYTGTGVDARTPYFSYDLGDSEPVRISPEEWLGEDQFNIMDASMSRDGGFTILSYHDNLHTGPIGGEFTELVMPNLADIGYPRLANGGQIAVFWCRGCGTTESNPNDGLFEDDNGLHHIILYKNEEFSVVDQAQDNSLADGLSLYPEISSDGRYVVFNTEADNLTTVAVHTGDDVILRDLETGAFELINQAMDGTPGDGEAMLQAITPDANLIVFGSGGTVLVAGEGNFNGLFLRDRQAGQTLPVKVPTGYIQQGAICKGISADGRYLLLDTDAYLEADANPNFGRKLFRYDRQTETMVQISSCESGGVTKEFGAEFAPVEPKMSADGSKVLFGTNFAIDADDTDGDYDLYVITIGEDDGGTDNGDGDGVDLVGTLSKVKAKCMVVGSKEKCSVSGKLTVTNQGKTESPAGTVSLFSSKTNEFSGDGKKLKNDLEFDALAAGAEEVLDVRLKAPLKKLQKFHFLMFEIDSDELLAEEDEENNTGSAKVKIRSAK